MEESNKGWIVNVALTPPSLKDNTADADRLLSGLKNKLKAEVIIDDLNLIKKIPFLLRQFNYSATCVLFKERSQYILVEIKDPRAVSTIGGIAVDLGTTRIALRLTDLISRKTLTEISFDNPQIVIGPDILTRIHFTDEPGGLEVLTDAVIQKLNHKIDEICRSCNIVPEDIYLFSLAGNTAMTHLFLGLDPHYIIREPYIPVINRPGIFYAKDIGIKTNPSARAFIFPCSGSYFGGDLISGILYSGINDKDETSILVDVGTNAEVAVGNKNWLIACAGAAGPALESGATKIGMTAGPGVVDRVKIDPNTLELKFHVIADRAPVGICGSGLIDLTAELFTSGMIDIRGKFKPSVCRERLFEKDGLRYLTVVPESMSGTGSVLAISQADIDSLIRSKAAMFTILETVTNTVGIPFSELSSFYVAGAFGSLINPESAITIGMMPDIPLERYKSLGNSSLEGATLILFGEEHLHRIDAIRDNVTYLELNVNQDFMNRFSAAKFIPHTDPSLFPGIKEGSS